MSGVNLSAMGAQLALVNVKLEKLSASDLTDPENMIQLQQAMTSFQELYGTISALIADYKSVVTSMIQKM